MVELKNVTKLYKTVIGVNDVSLEIGDGIYGLLGPNGSGKTTLINLIIGQLRPTMGTVRLFGKNPWTRDGLLRNVGLCPAVEVSYPKVTAYQWVRYMVQLHGFRSSVSAELALEALEAVNLTHAMHRPMREYSLGMRQRAKLAQSIAHKPDFLILDEPFSGLDPIGRFEMTNYLRSWIKPGKTLIIASHILHEVEAINPSFLLISGGRLLASGSPAEVREILADAPNVVRLRCSDAKRLSTRIAELPSTSTVQFSDDPQHLEITTQSPKRLFETLPEITRELGVQVSEMHSADNSLNSLFATLLKKHRGEF
jgi:ABC-2 type transport system ATP-binding protein